MTIVQYYFCFGLCPLFAVLWTVGSLLTTFETVSLESLTIFADDISFFCMNENIPDNEFLIYYQILGYGICVCMVAVPPYFTDSILL